MVSPNDGSNWVFDYRVIEDIPVPGGDLPSLDPPGSLWSSLSMEYDDSFGHSDDLNESSGSRKRTRPGSANAAGSKACREKVRRDKLNDRFMELGALLDPGRPKVDKSAILADAFRMVTQLRDESQKLRQSNESLQEKISELKAEKNELREEKQRLKTEKENLEHQMKALNTASSFLPHLPAIPAPYPAPAGHVVGSKLVPFVGYPGVSMWQFMPPAVVDTSQDHVLRPPVA